MCNFQCATGKCKISPKKDLCHIHEKSKKRSDQEFKDACLIITLNQKIDILTKISKTQSDLINTNKKAYDDLYNQHTKNIDEHNLLLTFADKMNQQYMNAKNEIKNLNKTIEKKNNVINDLLLEVNNTKRSKDEVLRSKQAMQIDYDKYQVIKEFELEKKKLINDGIDIYNYYDNDFHTKRFNRNKIAHLIEC